MSIDFNAIRNKQIIAKIFEFFKLLQNQIVMGGGIFAKHYLTTYKEEHHEEELLEKQNIVYFKGEVKNAPDDRLQTGGEIFAKT